MLESLETRLRLSRSEVIRQAIADLFRAVVGEDPPRGNLPPLDRKPESARKFVLMLATHFPGMKFSAFLDALTDYAGREIWRRLRARGIVGADAAWEDVESWSSRAQDPAAGFTFDDEGEGDD